MSYRKSIFFILTFLVNTTIWAQKNEFNIEKYGALGDGLKLNTKEIQKAVDQAHEKGGGVVIVPEGVFLSGGIILRSGVELHLNEGAVLLGSISPYDYQPLDNRWSFIVASGEKNISVTGKGIIDGQGRDLALVIDSLHHAGIRTDTAYNYYRMRPGVRPKLIEFAKCKNVRIEGVTLMNSASWVQNYDLCENVIIDGIRVESVAFWNNDGIDISDCKNVRITNCLVNSADDGICLKSHHQNHFNDSIYIANCTIRSSASAVKFGTASFGGFKNVKIENIKVYDTYRSAIAIESVDGGILENIEVTGVDARNTGNAIFIRLGHRNTEGSVGSLKNVTIKNVKVQIPFGRPDIDYDLRGPALSFFHNPFPASITGIPGHEVENVFMENIEISYPGRASKGMAYIPVTRLDQVPEKEDEYPEFTMFGELPAWGFYFRHVNGISLKNVTLKLMDKDYRPAFVFDDVKNLNISDIEIPENKLRESMVMKDCTDISIDEFYIDGKAVRIIE